MAAGSPTLTGEEVAGAAPDCAGSEGLFGEKELTLWMRRLRARLKSLASGQRVQRVRRVHLAHWQPLHGPIVEKRCTKKSNKFESLKSTSGAAVQCETRTVRLALRSHCARSVCASSPHRWAAVGRDGRRNGPRLALQLKPSKASVFISFNLGEKREFMASLWFVLFALIPLDSPSPQQLACLGGAACVTAAALCVARCPTLEPHSCELYAAQTQTQTNTMNYCFHASRCLLSNECIDIHRFHCMFANGIN